MQYWSTSFGCWPVVIYCTIAVSSITRLAGILNCAASQLNPEATSSLKCSRQFNSLLTTSGGKAFCSIWFNGCIGNIPFGILQIYRDLQHKPHASYKLLVINEFALVKNAINPCWTGNFWLILSRFTRLICTALNKAWKRGKSSFTEKFHLHL